MREALLLQLAALAEADTPIHEIEIVKNPLIVGDETSRVRRRSTLSW